MRIARFFRIILPLLLLPSFTDACAQRPVCQALYQPEDTAYFERIMTLDACHNTDATLRELTAAIGLARLGTPYVANTLESNEKEALVVNLHQTDCILFVESTICLALTTHHNPSPSFDQCCRQIRLMRYRNGVVDGYASRIHYTSEWIRQNATRGILKEITKDLGGIPLKQGFHFMSTHAASYRQLKDNPQVTAEIAAVEASLDTRDYYCLPVEKITEELTDKLQDGDIVCWCASIQGLDIAHVGFACRRPDGRMGFLHASSKKKEVTLDSLSLAEYAHKHNQALRIARLTE